MSVGMISCHPRRAKPEKNLKRTLAVSHNLHRAPLASNRTSYPPQPHLPRPVRDKISNSSKRVSPNAVGRENRGLGKQFILVDQFQPSKCVVALPEIQRRFKQIAVQIVAHRDLVHAPP